MTLDEPVEVIRDWFHSLYEDPAEKMPYQSAEGGYQWIWGGPYDADDQVQNEFSDVVEFETMQRAVRQIESDGIQQWAPKEPQPDWYDPEPSEESPPPRPGLPYTLPMSFSPAFNSGFGSGALGSAPLASSGWPSAETAHAEVLRRLEEIEVMVRPLLAGHGLGMMGHNHPPEPINDPPLTRNEWVEVAESVRVLREQATAPVFQEEVVRERASVLRSAGEAVAKCVLAKADGGFDAFMKATAAGLGLKVGWSDIANALTGAAEAIDVWLSTLLF